MPSLVSLAEKLLCQAKEIDKILEQNNLPYTSFDEDTLEPLPDDAQKIRWDLLDTSHDFRQLVRGARLSGLDIAFNVLFILLEPTRSWMLMGDSGPNKSFCASSGDTG